MTAFLALSAISTWANLVKAPVSGSRIDYKNDLVHQVVLVVLFERVRMSQMASVRPPP